MRSGGGHARSAERVEGCGEAGGTPDPSWGFTHFEFITPEQIQQKAAACREWHANRKPPRAKPFSRIPKAELLKALTNIQRKLCSYDGFRTQKPPRICDCKFGANHIGKGAEEGNGCPEMRLAIELVRGIPESCVTTPVKSGWQPIATAPKDGTEILICCDGRYYPVVAEYLGCGWSHHGGRVEDDGKHFTHWMPLPKPPE